MQPDFHLMSDEELLRAAQHGSADAFSAFCVRTLPTLVRRLRYECRALGIPVDQADDLAQATVVRAISHLQLYEADRGFCPELSPGWLFQIGHNLAIDWLRKNRRESRRLKEIVNVRKAQAPDKADTERREETLKFFRWLTPGEQDILEKVLLNGLSVLEAGRQLEISDDAAYKSYERAVKHLRDLIREHSDMADRCFIRKRST